MTTPTDLAQLLADSPFVGQLVQPEVYIADASDSVGDALLILQASNRFTQDYIVVRGRPHGILRAAQLYRATPSDALSSLEIDPIPTVEANRTAEEVAWIAAHAGAEAVAVVDGSDVLIGVLPSHRLLSVLVREHEVDMARLGGFLEGTSLARTASEEPVHRRVWHRAPWLLVGLAGAALSAQIVKAFEADLNAQVSLAFFLPGIIYMADAVGTQTETLLIRGLSVGSSIRRILRLELLTGTIVGILLSIAVLPLAMLLTGNFRVASIVALSLLAATSCATIIAIALPSLFQRFHIDPAFGSGPMATVIQDLLSILIYFAIAQLLL